MRKSNGFTLIEVLVAMSVFFMIAFTLVPLYTMIETERKHLYDKRNIINTLHDDLQEWIFTDRAPYQSSKKIGHRNVEMQFSIEGEWWKGCAYWEDVRTRKQSECIYAYK